MWNRKYIYIKFVFSQIKSQNKWFLSFLDTTIPQTLFGSVCSGEIFNPENVISETMYCNGVHAVITKNKRTDKVIKEKQKACLCLL